MKNKYYCTIAFWQKKFFDETLHIYRSFAKTEYMHRWLESTIKLIKADNIYAVTITEPNEPDATIYTGDEIKQLLKKIKMHKITTC